MSTLPWILRGRTGRLIDRWLDRHDLELVVHISSDGPPCPMAHTIIRIGQHARPKP